MGSTPIKVYGAIWTGVYPAWGSDVDHMIGLLVGQN